MADDEIILFDIPSKPPRKSWSYNPWKTRMLLNYKGLKYHTEWVGTPRLILKYPIFPNIRHIQLEYPQIRTRLEPHIPNPGTETPYTVPTILLPSGIYITDSTRILHAINDLYPSPPLPADTPASHTRRLIDALGPFMAAFRGIYVPGVAKNVLGEASLEYFHRTREQSIGMSLDEFEQKHGGRVAYAGMEPHLKDITALLKEDESGLFFAGREVTYADFIWAGVLIFMKKVGEGVFEEAMGRSGNPEVHRGLLEAVKVWTERDD
ncbi:hypothetical protein B0T16DRAFT_419794 [Cercophora newfieldiana]|uniref:GST N-terminal domain-containing protein n=1 Tax=Cercophora newfieldiana TaxID=92897 RepID=A0AA39XWI5_9PEZI|nr:hypothetical protein B0T16DRAFT_419794 [Cercophora newfieldiana]